MDQATIRVGRCRLITEKALRKRLERKTEVAVPVRHHAKLPVLRAAPKSVSAGIWVPCGGFLQIPFSREPLPQNHSAGAPEFRISIPRYANESSQRSRPWSPPDRSCSLHPFDGGRPLGFQWPENVNGDCNIACVRQRVRPKLSQFRRGWMTQLLES
jgi:hypothetical protein